MLNKNLSILFLSLLMSASALNCFHIETIKRRVHKGDHESAACIAAAFGESKILRELLTEHGVNLDTLCSRDLGYSLIHECIQYERLNTGIIETLAKHGANINAQTNPQHEVLKSHITGYTALHLAAFRRDEAAVKALLEAGANPLIENADGNKPKPMNTTKEIQELLKQAEQKLKN